MKRIIFGICFILLIALQFHNHFSFPWSRGFDAEGHVEYINYLKVNHRLPLPWEGWELYQPPFYYIFGSLLPTTEAAQWINCMVWFGVVIMASVIAKKMIPEYWPFIPLVVASYPISLYLSHTVGNESLVGLVIGISLWFYCEQKNIILTAIVAGVALLTKSTAWVLVAAIVISNHVSKRYKHNFLFVVITLLIGGWFYVRAYIVSGNPLATSVDYSQFAFSQLPGYRNLNFFVDLSPFWTGDIFRAHWYSFIPGTYFSWFWDEHNVIIPIQPNSKIGIFLLICSIPIIITMGIGLKETWWQKRYRISLVYSSLLIGAYIAYNLKYPFYSTVKATFIYSLIIPSTIWLCLGISKMSGKVMKLVPWYSLVYVIAVTYAFYIRPWWY